MIELLHDNPSDDGSLGLHADPADAPHYRHTIHKKTSHNSGQQLPWKVEKASGQTERNPLPPYRQDRSPLLSWYWLWRLAGWLLTLIIWIIIIVLSIVAWYAADLPDVRQSVSALQRKPTVTVLSADGEVVTTFGDLYGDTIRLRELPIYVPQAVIAIEDRRFYSHFGIDLLSILRAAFTNVQTGRVTQGGSTITQQVVKNLFLTSERHLKRKVQEFLLSLWLERMFTKEQILSLYLNRVYLGSGVYGFEAAAHRYFGCSARTLTLYQAAMLAGLPKAPSRYNPVINSAAADRRAHQVLSAMVDANFLDPEQAERAKATVATSLISSLVPTGRYFSDWILSQVSILVGSIKRDLVVVTTLDRVLQVGVENSLSTMLATPMATKADVGQAAVVVLTPNGAVQALVGGRDYSESQFNRATQSLRQPGSAFKPFVFLAGLESGLTTNTIIDDMPVTIGKWKPRNFSGRYEGPVTLTYALAHSINTVAVRIAERFGLSKIADVSRRCGLSMPVRLDATLALGTNAVTLLDLTAAYATLAASGQRAVPFGIVEIYDREGRTLYHHPYESELQAIQPSVVGSLTRLMREVLTHGTGRRAALERPAAGKTGTTQDYRDAWFIGFTADYVTGVWMGNDDNTSMKKEVTGGSLPAVLWREVMLLAHRSLPERQLPGISGTMPAVVEKRLDASTVSTAKLGNGLDGLIRSLFSR